MLQRVIVVFAGGPDPAPPVALPARAFVIAADAGAEQARELGVAVDVAIGDFDSLSPASLAALEQAGTRIDRYPAEKDASDLELALESALSLDPARIVVVGGAAGRLDHLAGGLLLLAADAYARVQVDAQLGAAAVHVVRVERTLTGTPGELVSLFAVHGPAAGVTTEGLRYALRGETLVPGSSRGLSNVFLTDEARVSVEQGVLLAIRPSGNALAGS
jgi:thiamine pyrophosphokinase